MDWRVCSLYKDFMYGYKIHKQTWWQRFKSKFTGKYEVTVSTPGIKKSKRTYILTGDYQRRFNPEYMTREGSLVNYVRSRPC